MIGPGEQNDQDRTGLWTTRAFRLQKTAHKTTEAIKAHSTFKHPHLASSTTTTKLK
jgi:hypothetical protein